MENNIYHNMVPTIIDMNTKHAITQEQLYTVGRATCTCRLAPTANAWRMEDTGCLWHWSIAV